MRLVPVLALLVPGLAAAQEPAEYVAQVEVEASGGALTLTFDDREPMTRTDIRRRPLSHGESWSGAQSVASLTAGELSWTDPDAVAGEVWEYEVRRYPADGAPYYAQALVAGAIEAPIVDERGTVALIVDETIAAGLSVEIDRLILDLVGDGWLVARRDVPRAMPVTEVKALIEEAEGDANGGDFAVFLLGHVPVPYSGAMNPDGHTDHYGAWPADLYYGELDSSWPDSSVNTTDASRDANDNVPGDGKFDPSSLPSEVDLMVGRVDMYDLPAFGVTEEELLRRYLDKDHAWRHAEVEAEKRALIDDNFGSYAPGAKSGWALAPLVGREALAPGDWITQLPTESWLFAYGCGGGSYTSASGVASTTDFVNNELNAVFTMIFGSYHGDWDVTDNLLRAAIAANGTTLTIAWAGRPNWWNHALGVGEPIGYVARWSQNNVEGTDYGGRFTHVALLGDPTLRMSPVAPPADLAATAEEGAITLTWSPSPAPGLLGYHVYRATEALGPYERVSADVIGATTFEDLVEEPGTWRYQVRAVALEDGFSGSYENGSQGIFATVDVVCENEGCEPSVEDTGTEEEGCKGCNAGGRGAGLALLPLLGAVLARRRRESA